MGVIGAAPVGDMRVVLGENDTAVLIALVIILKVICLLLISESEADPTEVYYFLPLNPDPLCSKRQKNIF